MEAVTVAVELCVERAEGVCVTVPVLVKEEVRLPELVRLGVPVLAALTVLEEEGVWDREPVPVSVPVIDRVCVAVRVRVARADEERLGLVVA